MTFVPSWKAHHKNKNDAFIHVLECLSLNPACADRDGTIKVQQFGNLIELKPQKKKAKVTNVNIED